MNAKENFPKISEYLAERGVTFITDIRHVWV